MRPTKSKQLHYKFDDKHVTYMRNATKSMYNVAEGAVRAGKTVDNVLAFALLVETSKDKYHLASGSTVGNAKLNIGSCNGLGLENIFRGRCRWGKHLSNEALFVKTAVGERIIIFSGGGKADSFKSIRGNSYGYWIATEIDQHHKTFIEEARFRQLMASDIKLFWDLNPRNPRHWIYTDYIDRWKEQAETEGLVGGYNYAHFTIFDNASLTEERKKQIISGYPKGTLSYRRGIMGERAIAEGLIYSQFANNTDKYYISYEEAKGLRYQYLNIGVDIGGNKSKHTFVLTGINYNEGKARLITLKSKKLETNLDPDQLAMEYVKFAKECLKDFKEIDRTYFENAEQVLKRGFKTKSEQEELYISIVNCIKKEINERISATNILIAQNRFYYTEEAEEVKEALCEATWCPKSAEKGLDVRLDDGTTDIDTLDAFEYSFERYINTLIR